MLVQCAPLLGLVLVTVLVAASPESSAVCLAVFRKSPEGIVAVLQLQIGLMSDSAILVPADLLGNVFQDAREVALAVFYH